MDGERLVWATTGCLWAGEVRQNGIQKAVLRDFNGLSFEPSACAIRRRPSGFATAGDSWRFFRRRSAFSRETDHESPVADQEIGAKRRQEGATRAGSELTGWVSRSIWARRASNWSRSGEGTASW